MVRSSGWIHLWSRICLHSWTHLLSTGKQIRRVFQCLFTVEPVSIRKLIDQHVEVKPSEVDEDNEQQPQPYFLLERYDNSGDDSEKALLTRLWVELRQQESLQRSYEFVRRYWTLEALCDGAIAVALIWIGVIWLWIDQPTKADIRCEKCSIELKIEFGHPAPTKCEKCIAELLTQMVVEKERDKSDSKSNKSKSAKKKRDAKDSDKNDKGKHGSHSKSKQVTKKTIGYTAIVFLVVAAIFLGREARRFHKYQLYELAATIGYLNDNPESTAVSVVYEQRS